MNYFPTELKPKADLRRHKIAELDLLRTLDNLERLQSPTSEDLLFLNEYKGFLVKLRKSKAELVSKIGKRK